MDIERLKKLKQQVFDSFQLYEVKMQNNFDESMKTATPTGEMDDDGKDLTALIDEAIARQSVKSEEVAEAIEWIQDSLDHYKMSIEMYSECEIGDNWHKAVKNAETAITALQAYQPTTRKNRTVEEAAISKTETTTCTTGDDLSCTD
ncbi:MAG: hypothetical protein PHF37_11315 [Phycisphaerae bacterium]|nr:hypothetical protein [Phycisphaerae bacterium]